MYRKYLEMTENGAMEPEKMALADRAGYYHGLRAHLQIITWNLLDSKEIQLDSWKWG